MLDELPHELLLLVLFELDARNVCRVGATCRELAAVAGSDSLWRHLLTRDFGPALAPPRGQARLKHVYAERVTRAALASFGSNEGPGDWGVDTQPRDMGGGQLGRPEEGFVPLVGVARVACGGYHSVAVDFLGRVFACGANAFGQLGLGSRDSSGGFQRAELPVAAAQVACGYAFSFVVARDGSVWSCGFAKNGRCAIEDDSIEQRSEDGHPLLLQFRRCSVFERLPGAPLQLACGSGHVLCLTAGGAVWSFGRNDCGQCGVPERETEVRDGFSVGVENVRASHVPRLVLCDPRVTGVAAGAYHSCAFGLGTGLLLTWGSNILGESAPAGDGAATLRPFAWPGLSRIGCVQLMRATIAWLPDEKAVLHNGRLQSVPDLHVRMSFLPFGVVGRTGRVTSMGQTRLAWLGRVHEVQCSSVHGLAIVVRSE